MKGLERGLSGLPHAAQLRPVPGLPPVDADGAVPTRVSSEPYKRLPTPPLRRPGRTFLGAAPLLVLGALIAAGAGFLVLATRPDAPTPVPSETRLDTPSPPQAVVKGGASAESEFSEQEVKLTMSSEDKLTKSETEGRSPQAPPAPEYRTTGDTSAMPGSNSVDQSSSSRSADAAIEAHDSAPPIERERRFAASAHVSTCFPSASAVRQDHPEAWPSWTSRAPGHEGTKCWYASTRAAAHDH